MGGSIFYFDSVLESTLISNKFAGSSFSSDVTPSLAVNFFITSGSVR